MDAETVDRLHTKNAKVHKIDPYNWVENLIGFIVGYDIILRYYTSDGKLLIRENLGRVKAQKYKPSLEDELQLLLSKRKHRKLNEYQNEILQLLRWLTKADIMKDNDALKLICDTMDEYVKIKEKNKGAGSELIGHFTMLLIRKMEDVFKKEASSPPNASSSTYRDLLLKMVKTLQADMLCEILLNMGYSLNYLLPFALKTYRTNPISVDCQNYIDYMRGRIIPAKHKPDGLAAADKETDPSEDTRKYLHENFKPVRAELLDHEVIRECFDVEVLVRATYFIMF